ncbi:hypothetical protein FMN50_09430 [Rhodobacterales bacterium]|nr:hypothetical protein FMN50_09430 [Rhodobacterales bacterium]
MDAGQEIAVQVSTPNPMHSAPLSVAVRRAIGAVEEETRALREDPTTDLKTFEYSKSQALLDLTRARSKVPPSSYSDDLRMDLKDLKDALNENMKILKLHMSAVSEVVEMMSKTLIAYDSDGTYQAPFPERAR